MTRSFSPEGIPGQNVADYYRRRAEGQVGLILTEGTVVDRPSASNDPNVPHFYGEKALASWEQVVQDVHAADGKIGPQLWHQGIVKKHHSGWEPPAPFEGPSGLGQPGLQKGKAMTDSDIADTIAAFARAAADTKRFGFDCLELHGAHGYLFDQFFWAGTNERTDAYGGKTLHERSRFAAETIREVRKAVGDDFVISLRISQWKQQDYTVQMAQTPQELADWLTPLADAGVDIFHCSQRRYWEPEFADSDLNLAGWVKKLTGKMTITVGSIGLSGEFLAGFGGEVSTPQHNIDELISRLDRQEFDLVAVGRPLIADPDWIEKIQQGRTAELRGFSREMLSTLV